MIEGVRVKDIVHLCIQILRSITRDQDILNEVMSFPWCAFNNNKPFQVVFFLQTPENSRMGDGHTLPIFVLQKANIEENTKSSTLALIYNLMHHEGMADVLDRDDTLSKMLQNVQMQSVTHPDLGMNETFCCDRW